MHMLVLMPKHRRLKINNQQSQYSVVKTLIPPLSQGIGVCMSLPIKQLTWGRKDSPTLQTLPSQQGLPTSLPTRHLRSPYYSRRAACFLCFPTHVALPSSESGHSQYELVCILLSPPQGRRDPSSSLLVTPWHSHLCLQGYTQIIPKTLKPSTTHIANSNLSFLQGALSSYFLVMLSLGTQYLLSLNLETGA